MQNTECNINNALNDSENTQRTTRIHGGNIYEAARRFGIDAEDIVDFSSSVNPLGPPSSVKRAVKRSVKFLNRYPDPEMNGLRKAIARYFGIKLGHVVCGSGSNGLIRLIPRVFRPKRVLIPVPTFMEYAAAAEDAGGKVVMVPLKEREGFRVDPLEMAFALKGVDMAFLCNPNNPTGLLIPKAEMLEIMQYALQHGVRLVVDEAFMDFSDSDSIVKEAVQSSHLICLRAVTAFFGMPGLQIGYAVTDETTAANLRDGQEPWAMSIPAEQAAIAALNEWGYIKKTRRLIEKERERLLSAIRILPGVEPFPCSANFILLKLTSIDAWHLTEKLGQRGLLIRDCSSFPGLSNRYVRIAVLTRRENNRLVEALREFLIA
ncbi:MAG TPA: threonine-phosphate decarboxylase CobD [Nitrospirota bacterium]|nr:threonine-phosphate decarboxylase CobD [Nitrospirota bacterium]